MAKFLASLTTLCYIERDGKYLMLHRVKKEHDINKDKWIGVGGHFEKNESPDECLRREVLEETGCMLERAELRGIVTFISGSTAGSPGGDVNDSCDVSADVSGDVSADVSGDVSADVSGDVSADVSGDGVTEYMFLYTGSGLCGELIECDEGEFAWIDKEAVFDLELWEGDKIFLRLLEERRDFFSLKLVYDGSGNLIKAELDGEQI